MVGGPVFKWQKWSCFRLALTFSSNGPWQVWYPLAGLMLICRGVTHHFLTVGFPRCLYFDVAAMADRHRPDLFPAAPHRNAPACAAAQASDRPNHAHLRRASNTDVAMPRWSRKNQFVNADQLALSRGFCVQQSGPSVGEATRPHCRNKYWLLWAPPGPSCGFL